MGYISLPSNLNAIIGITSYYCVILKMVILHHAIKTFRNGVFVFFCAKRTKNCFFSKKQKMKNRWVVILTKAVFPNLDCLSILFVISLDRTLWNKSRHYQFEWVCATNLECGSLVMKKVRITGI